MFRLYLIARRTAVHRIPATPTFIRPFHSTITVCANEESLYNTLLADVQNELEKRSEASAKRKSRRPRKSEDNDEGISQTDLVAPPKKGGRLQKIKSDDDGLSEVPVKMKRPRIPKGSNSGGSQRDSVITAKSPAKRKSRAQPRPPLEEAFGASPNNLKEFLVEGYKASAKTKARMTSADKKRIHIISEELCDDILDRLSPSLERHVGCDIVDINPGVALWSSKLHSRLKPRSHILLEPEDKFYGPCLKPLLDNQDSTYRLVPKSGLVWGHLEAALAEHLPNQEQYKTGDLRLEKENNTLLVVANIGYHPAKAYAGFASLSMLVLNQFMSAMRSHTLFEKYGLVRVLVWAGDTERRVLLPVQINSRRKTALEAELTCNISEVASSTEPARYRREISQDVKGAQAVLNKMQEAGIKTPQGRESILFRHITEQDKGKNTPNGRSAGDSITRNGRKLAQLEADYAAGKFSKYKIDPKVGAPVVLDDPNLYTPEYTYLTRMRNRYKRNTVVDENAHKRIREVLALMERERTIFEAKSRGENVEAEENQLKEGYQSWRDHILYVLSDTDQRSLLYILDNELAFSSKPQLLLWDRRNIEPLRVQSDEFFPNKPMCLLDMQPRSLRPSLRKDRGAQDLLEFLLGNLYIQPAQSMKKGLSSLWPGAYEWLVAECPSLTNPFKGGCIDLEMIRVRIMTIEMVEEIVEAWDRWPFKPTRVELLSRMGASGHEIAETDED